jgi:hypothetical protein
MPSISREPIVDRVLEDIDRRTVSPVPAILQRMYNPRRQTAVVHQLHVARTGRRQRLDPSLLGVQKPKAIRHAQ